MRLIGHIPDETHAHRFGDYLLAQGMENDVEPSSQGWAIWVHDEDQLKRAAEELSAFLASPDDVKFQNAHATARTIRKKTQQAEIRRARLHIDVRTHWHSRMHGVRPLTLFLIFLCLLVGTLTKLGADNQSVMNMLMFHSMPDFQNMSAEEMAKWASDVAKEMPPASPHAFTDPDDLDGWAVDHMMRTMHKSLVGDGFAEVGQGEVWRIISPIFLHFGWLHLVFNMFWLYDLGGLIEIRKGSWFLGLIVVIVAVISNIAQCWMEGPFFGGMSGVVYGLFGYIWMLQRYQPHLQIALAPNTVLMMLGWLILCMTGAIGPIANTAHVVGLAVGAALGVTGPFIGRMRKRMS